MTTPKKPDYNFWSKIETWSLHQAALILSGFDPQESKIRLTENLPSVYN